MSVTRYWLSFEYMFFDILELKQYPQPSLSYGGQVKGYLV